jgi:O-methyltransferase involved in polyketide biosynthesis
MVEHQMWERLFTHCKKGDTIALTIEQYESYLKPHFEKEILDIYREYVEEQALITHNSAYEWVAHMLKRMRTFDGGNAVTNQLLQEYRNTYKRRRNMMAALKNV